eukprot:12580096-Alexandrium_andersonii.AAC.1
MDYFFADPQIPDGSTSFDKPAPSVGSGLIPEFFEAFALVAGDFDRDPDADLALWIRSGAPLGVLRP